MDGSFLSLTPPVLVLALGFMTRKVLLSLASGILLAAFVANDFAILPSLQFAIEKCWKSSEVGVFFNPSTLWQSWNAFICIFLLILGIFITLIHHCGGAFAYKRFIHKRLHSRKQVEASSLVLSKCLCIDDYFSSLTVGSVMHPITDSYRIPRAKLAFMVDAMAAPLTILCPVSSWVAAIVGFLRDNGVNNTVLSSTRILGSPYLAYLNVIPFVFYSFIIIASAWILVLKDFSFGLMGRHEACAQSTGNVFNGKEAPVRRLAASCVPVADVDGARVWDFTVPVFFLVSSVLGGILGSGGWELLGGDKSFVDALRDASAAKGLFCGGALALFTSILYFCARKRLELKNLPSLSWQGVRLMAGSCLVLLLAWTLGGILRNELGTGQYLAGLMTGRLPLAWIPFMFFLASVATAFAIGSAWGTAAVMFPIAIQLILSVAGAEGVVELSQLSLLYPTLGAVLSGCVAGDHLSPISDTTIMSSTSTAMEHSDHVETQITYALPAIGVSAFAYLCLGYLVEAGFGAAAVGLSLFAAMLILYGVLSFLNQGSKPLAGVLSSEPVVQRPSS